MPISWKTGKKLRPAIILDRITSIRTVTAEGRASFSGFELEDALPALQSMLEFPAVADQIQRSTLVWKALASITGDLTPKSFIAAINDLLSKQIATREAEFHILTTLSINPKAFPSQLRIEGVTIRLLSRGYARKYNARGLAIERARISVDTTPEDYCAVIVKVSAKSALGAMTKALWALDLQRAIWCLICNSGMELRGKKWNPINRVRLGSIHTAHNPDGTLASDEIWFEPNFTTAPVFCPDKPDTLEKNRRHALRKLDTCAYRGVLCEALLRYVRAFDERDPNTAFLRLWGALESLTSPEIARYDQVVRRCSFLFREAKYHEQILEHLRAYRNQSVHAGDESDNAKTHCFQLQLYFSHMVWFHLGSAHFFRSLDEANAFLDFPNDQAAIYRLKMLIDKAVRFIKPVASV
jgi:hypothetical protein